MTTLWSTMVPLAQQTPNPNDVGPGLMAFVVFIFLVVAVVFLALSFRKQLRKVDFEAPEDDQKTESRKNGRAQPGAAR